MLPPTVMYKLGGFAIGSSAAYLLFSTVGHKHQPLCRSEPSQSPTIQRLLALNTAAVADADKEGLRVFDERYVVETKMLILHSARFLSCTHLRMTAHSGGCANASPRRGSRLELLGGGSFFFSQASVSSFLLLWQKKAEEAALSYEAAFSCPWG